MELDLELELQTALPEVGEKTTMGAKAKSEKKGGKSSSSSRSVWLVHKLRKVIKVSNHLGHLLLASHVRLRSLLPALPLLPRSLTRKR